MRGLERRAAPSLVCISARRRLCLCLPGQQVQRMGRAALGRRHWALGTGYSAMGTRH